jgi:hypothetical protein
VYGKLELERLIVDVVRTLRDARLQDTLNEFEVNVLSRPAADLVETPDDGSDPSFRPMVELLLLELAALGADASLSPTERHARAVAAMRLAGF